MRCEKTSKPNSWSHWVRFLRSFSDPVRHFYVLKSHTQTPKDGPTPNGNLSNQFGRHNVKGSRMKTADNSKKTPPFLSCRITFLRKGTHALCNRKLPPERALILILKWWSSVCNYQRPLHFVCSHESHEMKIYFLMETWPRQHTSCIKKEVKRERLRDE